MMDLIDEQDRFSSRRAQTIRGRGQHAAHLGNITLYTADPNEVRMRHLSDDSRQRGLTTTRRPVENYRRQAISFNRATQKFSRRKDMFLADKFLQRVRPYPCGQRRSGVCRFVFLRLLE